MRIENKEELFKPFKIVIETEDEARLFWHLLNCNDFGKYGSASEIKDLDKKCDKSKMWEDFDQELRKRGIVL